MKRIAIGRGRECDIRIKDSSDKISRRQCVITSSITGKLHIYDTSANGTFLNGEKVPVPDGLPLKKGDSINFAHVAEFDWSQWKDPYRSVKIMSVTILAAVVVIALLFAIFADRLTKKTAEEPKQEVPKEEVVAADTVVSAKIVSPMTEPEPKEPAPAVPKQKTKNKHKNPKVEKPKGPAEEPAAITPDPRLKGGNSGGDVSDDELNRRRKMK